MLFLEMGKCFFDFFGGGGYTLIYIGAWGWICLDFGFLGGFWVDFVG